MKLRLFCIVVLLTIWVLGMFNCIEAEEKAIGTARSSLAVDVGKLKISDDAQTGNNIISAAFAQVVAPNFALKLSVGQTKVDVKEMGEIILTPFIGAIQFRIQMSNKQLLPYMEAGIGHYRAKADFKEMEESLQERMAELEREYPGALIESTVEGEVESKLAYHIGAGLEYAVNQNFALYGNARYVFLRPHLEAEMKSTATYLGIRIPPVSKTFEEDINLNSWWIFIGAKMSFSAF
jgi:outer membrane protein W